MVPTRPHFLNSTFEAMFIFVDEPSKQKGVDNVNASNADSKTWVLSDGIHATRQHVCTHVKCEASHHERWVLPEWLEPAR